MRKTNGEREGEDHGLPIAEIGQQLEPAAETGRAAARTAGGTSQRPVSEYSFVGSDHSSARSLADHPQVDVLQGRRATVSSGISPVEACRQVSHHRGGRVRVLLAVIAVLTPAHDRVGVVSAAERAACSPRPPDRLRSLRPGRRVAPPRRGNGSFSRTVAPSSRTDSIRSQNARRALRVEARGRLVKEDELGPADDPQRHVEPPPLPAGQPRGEDVALLVEPDRLDDASGSRGSDSYDANWVTASATVRNVNATSPAARCRSWTSRLRAFRRVLTQTDTSPSSRFR